MNKAELVNKMSQKCDLSKKDTEAALNAFLKTVEEALAAKEKVQIIGFGTFESRKRAARQGRNPRKPEEIIHIDETWAPSFKAGKNLKDLCNVK